MNAKYEFTGFGTTFSIDWDFGMKSLVKGLESLKAVVAQEHILSYNGFETISFYINSDPKIYDYDIISWLFHKFADDEYQHDIRGWLCSVSTEDVAWTKQRNEGLRGIWYRKITLNDTICEAVKSECDRLISEISDAIYNADVAERAKKEAEEAEKKKLLNGVQWSITEIPVVDEGGKTIEYHHQITINGRLYIFHERNIFDFGRAINYKNGIILKMDGETVIYHGGDEDAEKMTADELRAYTIVNKYGKYANASIRM